jgi:hypothetical protein
METAVKPLPLPLPLMDHLLHRNLKETEDIFVLRMIMMMLIIGEAIV